jgi:hypothetical protein
MILHPSVLALIGGSLLVSFMVVYSAWPALQVLRKWDIQSGSEQQLILERKTYLISTLLAFVFGFELLSFFLFIYTADQIHSFFVGAMCAAGSLFADPLGYPVLLVKMVNFLLAGVWLVLNHVDNKGYDYPLIKKKYLFFLLFAPLILGEAVLQAGYFLRLKPDLITSCCGTLFSRETGYLPTEILFAPRIPAMAAFYVVTAATVGSGLFVSWKGKGGYLFSGLSLLTFVVSLFAILSFVSLYIYELPTHHCPFCILQKEYGYIGYPLYAALFGGTILGLGVGALMPFRNIKSLSRLLPGVQRRLALMSSVLFSIFAGLVTVRILLSNLVL